MGPPLRTSSGLASAGGMVYRTSSDMAALAALREQVHEAPRTPRTPQKSRLHHPLAARQAGVARRRRRSLLSRFFVAALVIAVLTGTTSYRMHSAEQAYMWDEDDMGSSWDGVEGGSTRARGGALAGLRSWLSGSRSASRRSLREGPPGLADVNLAPPNTARQVAVSDPGAGAAGAYQFERWWLLDGFTQLRSLPEGYGEGMEGEGQAQQQQEQHLFGSDGSGEREEASPVQRLLRVRRLQPSALRLYDFKLKSWVQHNVTRIPVDVPLARWAVTSLLNKQKKKESIIFLVGGYATTHEIAALKPPRSPKMDAGGGMVTLRTAGAGAALAGTSAACPLASVNVYSVNTGRSRFKQLPQLPEARYGGAALVAGARLHYLGGWATPDLTARLAQPAATHWSIGLNADGSSAPEWQEEQQLPPELVGRRLTVIPLSPDEDGEPGLYTWTDGSSDSAAPSSGEAACYAELGPSADSSSDDSSGSSGSAGSSRVIQLWSFASSTGWQKRGPLPQPLADDLQCAVGFSSHELVAVGSLERSGIFSYQRGLWVYDASNGGSWSRAGWAPSLFEGQLCALYHSRLYTSAGLPPEPEMEATNELQDVAEAAAEMGAAAAEDAEAGDGDAAAGGALTAQQAAEMRAEVDAASEGLEAAARAGQAAGVAAVAAEQDAGAAAAAAEAQALVAADGAAAAAVA